MSLDWYKSWGVPIKFSRTPGRFGPFPEFSQHAEEILSRICSLGDQKPNGGRDCRNKTNQGMTDLRFWFKALVLKHPEIGRSYSKTS